MSYFDDWNRNIEAKGGQQRLSDYAQRYYSLETEAYRKILGQYPEVKWSGKAAELAETLGFGKEMDIFLGFLEGINGSLKTGIDLPAVEDESLVDLDIDFAKLYWNMHEASAKWLYELEEWEKVFSAEQLRAMTKDFNREHIAVSNKVGRNSPCTCGSGKKYKNCCGKRA